MASSKLSRAILPLIIAFTAVAFIGGCRVPEPQVVEITATEYQFSPSQITLKEDTPTDIVVTNKGQIEHEFEAEIDGERIEKHVKPGETVTLMFIPKRKGETQFWCAIKTGDTAHRDLGMEGDITIE